MIFYPDRLRSERLITRFISPEDAHLWIPFFRSEKATALFPDFGLITAEEKAQYWIKRIIDRYETERYGFQWIYLKGTDVLVGQAGLLLQEVDGKEELEVGYHMLPNHWGNGYAPEAAKMFIDFAKEQQLSDSIISIIDIRNQNSQRVAQKNGLSLEKTTLWNNLTVGIHRKTL